MWVGEVIIAQGVGLCSSKEDKYRYRWVNENRLSNNINKDSLPYRVKSGKYGEYKQYRVENEDICSIANTILKMAKKRAEIDAALLVGSLSELFTQDVEDLPAEYLGNDKLAEKVKSKPVPKKEDTDLATMPQVNLIKTQIVGSHLFDPDQYVKDKSIVDLLKTGLTKTKASEIINWWKGDSKKMIIGERTKRESKENQAKAEPTKEEKIKQAREIVENPDKLELREGKTGLLDDDEEMADEEPGSSINNAIPRGKTKK